MQAANAELASPPQAGSGRLRAVALTVVVVFLGAFGNLSLAWGMKHVAVAMGVNPAAYLRAIASPFVGLGVLLLILWLLTRMVLLSRADLSFVLPATATGYVVNAILSVLILKETITPAQWAGTLLIFLGAVLVGSESHAKTETLEAAHSEQLTL